MHFLLMGMAFLMLLMGADSPGFSVEVEFPIRRRSKALNRNASIPLEKICQHYTAQMERRHRIPGKLLHAVALTESGKETANGQVAWPWTINVKGKGSFFNTKAEAIAAVRRLQQKGVTCIDVGCMQINLQYHPEAFSNLEEAFDPAVNIAYGASFLKNLHASHNDWNKAVAHYHSATPKLNKPYQNKVLQTWLAQKRKGETLLSKLQTSPHSKASSFTQRRRPSKQRLPDRAPSWLKGGSSKALANLNEVQRVPGNASYWTQGKHLMRTTSSSSEGFKTGASHVWSRLKKRPSKPSNKPL